MHYRFMPKFRPFSLGLLSWLISAYAAYAATTYEFEINQYDFEGFEARVHGHDIFHLDSWEDIIEKRMDLELLIFQVAPVLGGCGCEIRYTPNELVTPIDRSQTEVSHGHKLAHAVPEFIGDKRLYEGGLLLSTPILQADDFYVGLYTYEGRDEVLSIDSAEDISKLKFIVGDSWQTDIDLLQEMGVNFELAPSWASAVRQLVAGRADVIMQPFWPSHDLSFYDDVTSKKFLPIPNYRLPFPQGRAYYVSEIHPQGPKFLEALNRGIEILDGDDGFLRKAHIMAGVIEPRTDVFEIVFPKLQTYHALPR